MSRLLSEWQCLDCREGFKSWSVTSAVCVAALKCTGVFSNIFCLIENAISVFDQENRLVSFTESTDSHVSTTVWGNWIAVRC